MHGQAMGLYGTGLMVWQAIGALLAGLVAGVVLSRRTPWGSWPAPRSRSRC